MNVRKTFCDCCNKEIDTVDRLGEKIELDSGWKTVKYDVCVYCQTRTANMIRSIFEKIRNERKDDLP